MNPAAHLGHDAIHLRQRPDEPRPRSRSRFLRARERSVSLDARGSISSAAWLRSGRFRRAVRVPLDRTTRSGSPTPSSISGAWICSAPRSRRRARQLGECCRSLGSARSDRRSGALWLGLRGASSPCSESSTRSRTARRPPPARAVHTPRRAGDLPAASADRALPTRCTLIKARARLWLALIHQLPSLVRATSNARARVPPLARGFDRGGAESGRGCPYHRSAVRSRGGALFTTYHYPRRRAKCASARRHDQRRRGCRSRAACAAGCSIAVAAGPAHACVHSRRDPRRRRGAARGTA